MACQPSAISKADGQWSLEAGYCCWISGWKVLSFFRSEFLGCRVLQSGVKWYSFCFEECWGNERQEPSEIVPSNPGVVLSPGCLWSLPDFIKWYVELGFLAAVGACIEVGDVIVLNSTLVLGIWLLLSATFVISRCKLLHTHSTRNADLFLTDDRVLERLIFLPTFHLCNSTVKNIWRAGRWWRVVVAYFPQ